MHSDLSLEFLRVVEEAAIACAHTMGQGDRHKAGEEIPFGPREPPRDLRIQVISRAGGKKVSRATRVLLHFCCGALESVELRSPNVRHEEHGDQDTGDGRRRKQSPDPPARIRFAGKLTPTLR